MPSASLLLTSRVGLYSYWRRGMILQRWHSGEACANRIVGAITVCNLACQAKIYRQKFTIETQQFILCDPLSFPASKACRTSRFTTIHGYYSPSSSRYPRSRIVDAGRATPAVPLRPRDADFGSTIYQNLTLSSCLALRNELGLPDKGKERKNGEGFF